MKTFYCCRWVVFILLMYVQSGQAQTCSNTLQVTSYDTTVNSSGNDLYHFSMPRFDAAVGTLLAVKIESEVTLSHAFQIENEESNSTSIRVKLGRDDQISSSSIPSDISNSYIKDYGFINLQATDGINGSGPDYYAKPMGYVMNHVVFGDSLSNTADFLGSGSVDFDYISSTYSIIFSSAKFLLNASSADTITFRIKYYYCTGTLLKAGLTAFNAVKNKQATVDLNWRVENEEAGRHYRLQKSTDGQHFETIYQTSAAPGINATGYYKFNYRPGQNESGKIQFRLEQTEKNGAISYSPLRMVDLGNKSAGNASLYPNPTSGSSTLVFSDSQKGNWLVAVYSATGKLLQQTECKNALSMRINGNGSLAKGLYLVRIINENTGEMQVRQLIIQ